MSGGVDSSVAALRLRSCGYQVTGAMFRFWPDDRPSGAFDLCCSPDAAHDARRVADAIDIRFYLFDAREPFDDIVIQPFVPSYERGETPNPCVWCNRDIKFGLLFSKARMLDCDYIATGHYVRRVDVPGGVELHRGKDDNRDQSYFLWALPKGVLPHLLFPLGDDTKERVRQEAMMHGLLSCDKPSSHGLCFISGSVRDYLKEHSTRSPGPVLDATDHYRRIGEHDGVQYYTIGQRKGLGLYKSHLERFVLEVRPEDNAVIVGNRDMCQFNELEAGRANFLICADRLPERILVQTRYRQPPVPATLADVDGDRFRVSFDEPVFAIAPGQSAVLYEGSRLLGGGVIDQRR